MREQERVAAFVREHGMETEPTYRLLDLSSEVGEVAKDAVESTDYGTAPGDLRVSETELDDVLFSVLALAEELGVDTEECLDAALAKYERRLTDSGTAGSDG